MPQIPSTYICAACGRRPATVQVVMADGNARRAEALCETCAQRLMMSSAAGAGSPFGPRGMQQTAAQQQQGAPSKTPALDDFGRDLTADAAERRIDPVIGRAEEIEETVEILSRRRKNNAVLIGEPGVGKTA